MSAAFSTTRIGVRLLAVVLLAFAPALSLGAAAGDAKPRVSKPKQQARATYRLLKQWDDEDCKDHNKNKDKCAEAPPPPPPTPPPPEAVPPPPAAEPPPPAPTPPPPPPTPPPPPGAAPEQPPAPVSGDPTGTTEDLSEPSVEQTPPDAAGNDAALAEPVAPPASNERWLEPAPSAPVEQGTAPSSQSVPSFAAAPASSPLPQTFSAPVPAPAPEPDAGDFESTDGWTGANSELTVIRDGLTGNAVRVRRTSRNDSFAVVAAKAIAGSNPRHRARAFVRSTSPGMFVCLRIEELSARSRVPRMSERCRPATTGWQRVSVETRATARGTRLVVSVRVLAALGGTSFDVDGFRLR